MGQVAGSCQSEIFPDVERRGEVKQAHHILLVRYSSLYCHEADEKKPRNWDWQVLYYVTVLGQCPQHIKWCAVRITFSRISFVASGVFGYLGIGMGEGDVAGVSEDNCGLCKEGVGEAIILCRWHVVWRPKVKKLGVILCIDVAGVPKKAAWKSFIIFA